MFKLKKVKIKDFLDDYGLVVSRKFEPNVKTFPLGQCEVKAHDYPYDNFFIPENGETSNDLLDKQRLLNHYIKSGQNELARLNESVEKATYSKVKCFFDKDYRAIIDQAHKRIEETRKALTIEALAASFKEDYLKYGDIMEEEVNIIDQPFRNGDKVYAIYLGSLTNFDDVMTRKPIELREYVITKMRINDHRRFFLGEKNKGRPDFQISFHAEINQEDKDVCYESSHIDFQQKEDGDFKIQNSYSNLRFYRSKEEAIAEYRSIKNALIHNLQVG